jgi:hypothetical protein
MGCEAEFEERGDESLTVTSGADAGFVDWASRPLSSAGLDGQMRYNFGKMLAVDGAGYLHATWVSVTGTVSGSQVQGEIYHQRSTDGGVTWSAAVPLSLASNWVSHPKIAAFGPYVYVVWHELRSGVPHTVIARSSDLGLKFSAPEDVHSGYAAVPTVTAHATLVYVAWMAPDLGATPGNNGNYPFEIHVRVSGNSGEQWLPPQMISATAAGGGDGRTSWTPVLAAEGPNLYVAWTDERNNEDPNGVPFDCVTDDAWWTTKDGCREDVYFRKSTYFGFTWEAEQQLSQGVGIGHNAADMVVDNGVIHVAYFRKPPPTDGIVYRRSTNSGTSFDDEKLLDVTQPNGRPSIAANGSQVGIAYHGYMSTGGTDLFYIESGDSGANFGDPQSVVPGNGDAEQPHLQIDAFGYAHITFQDAATPGSTTKRAFYTRMIPLQ